MKPGWIAQDGVVGVVGVSLTRPNRLAAICYVVVLGAIVIAVYKQRSLAAKQTLAAAWCAVLVLVGLTVDRGLAFSDTVATRSRFGAVRSGWYEGRQPLQVGLTMVCVAIAVVLARRWWRLGLAAPWAMITGGVVGLVVLRMLRLVSLHQIDTFFELGAGRLTLVVVLELALLALSASGAALVLRTAGSEEVACSTTSPTG